jgi:hypothetical protein
VGERREVVEGEREREGREGKKETCSKNVTFGEAHLSDILKKGGCGGAAF